MAQIVHAQTVLNEDTLKELKQKTGENATKDAIATAVDHFLRCSYTNEEPLEGKLEEIMKSRRK
ncbi:MAG: DUF5371 family protein [Archaeoglobaceae archaeon]